MNRLNDEAYAATQAEMSSLAHLTTTIRHVLYNLAPSNNVELPAELRAGLIELLHSLDRLRMRARQTHTINRRNQFVRRMDRCLAQVQELFARVGRFFNERNPSLNQPLNPRAAPQ